MARKTRKGAKAGAKGARVGARVGTWAAPKAGRVAGKAAWKLGKGEAKLVRSALSSREPRSARYVKYGFFALIGFAIGALISRSGKDGDASSSFTDTTGHHTPDAGSPAGQRGTTWGSGTPTGAAGGQRPEDPNRTGADRTYSDPSSGPLIGEQHREQVGEVPVQQEEVENRIRTRLGEDPRTMDMPRVNVEVNDGVAELRGEAPSEDAKAAAGEIASGIEGVREVRNMITVSS
ncbi:MAG TPA: BON domain-containing protein [Rubrobacteraceae bacterium]|nr:BON domain-containing protein [Rubrobacteraceae bacterium]